MNSTTALWTVSIFQKRMIYCFYIVGIAYLICLKGIKYCEADFFCQTALQNGTRYMWHATTRFCRKSEMKFRKVFFNKKGSIEFLHFMDFSYSFHGPANKGPNPKVNLKETWVCQMITMSRVVHTPVFVECYVYVL